MTPAVLHFYGPESLKFQKERDSLSLNVGKAKVAKQFLNGQARAMWSVLKQSPNPRGWDCPVGNGNGTSSTSTHGLKVGGDSPMENWEVLSKHEGRKAGQVKTDMHYNYYSHEI